MMTRSHSITNNTLLLIGGVCGALLLLATIAVYAVTLTNEKRTTLTRLHDYGDIVVQRENARFDALKAIQQDANAQFQASLDAGGLNAPLSAENEAVFNRLFPLASDGTRRSIADLYRGMVLPSGSYVDGVAAYIRDGETISNARKRAFMAAFYIVAHNGKRIEPKIDNFFFASKDTDLIVYVPSRSDKAAFYRSHAPSDLDVTKQQFYETLSLRANPGRETVCGDALQRFNVPTADRNTSTCQTPTFHNNDLIGSFGSVLALDKVYGRTYDRVIKNIDIALINTQGRAITAPEALLQSGFDVQFKPLSASNTPFGAWLAQALNQSSRSEVNILDIDPTERFLVASKALDLPQWHMVLIYQHDLLVAAARAKAQTVLVSGLIGLLFLCIILALALRLGIGVPLEAFIVETRRLRKSVSGKDCDIPKGSLPTERKDEIGALARSFESLAEQVIDAQRSLTNRVETRTNQLNIEKIKAEHASRAKTRFVASMSHELRTPLNAIVGFAGMLREDASADLNEECASHLEHLVFSADHLKRLVDGVLDFAKLDVGSMRLKRDRIDLAICFEEALRLIQTQSKLAEVTVTHQAPDAGKCIIMSDQMRLVQVLVNLLTNAIKFNQKGGRVHLAHERGANGSIRILVSDDGLGIPADQRELIFEPFERLEDANGAAEGAGIGLSLCKQIIDEMNGAIGVSAGPGGGSVFWIDLTQQATSAEPSQDIAEAAA